jgi:hypothetical protein
MYFDFYRLRLFRLFVFVFLYLCPPHINRLKIKAATDKNELFTRTQESRGYMTYTETGMLDWFNLPELEIPWLI